MNCRQISSNLSAFLDNNVSNNEEILIMEHLSTCEDCRAELAELRITRQSVVNTMHALADSAEPPAQAWAGVQQRIRQVKGSHTSTNQNRLSSLAPGWMVMIFQNLGALQMSRKIAVVISGAFIFGVLGFFMMNEPVTPVSAKEILDKAYEVQMNAEKVAVISHMKIERYFNPEMKDGNDVGTRILSDIFTDYKTGNYRKVEYSLPEMKVISVAGYDGENTYSSIPLDKSHKGDALTVYRSPQSRDKVAGLDNLGPTFSAEKQFDSIRNDPKISLESEKVHSDGLKVYVLVANHPAESFRINGKVVEGDAHLERMIFDAKTYELLESETFVKKNGKEIIISSLRFLVRENLSTDSSINWDLNDLKGIKFVDDLDRTKGDLLPEKITQKELAEKTSTGYLFKEIPEGFDLTITAPPSQTNEPRYIYIADYHNKDGDYIVIQDTGDQLEPMSEDPDETYKAKNGMTAYFIKEPENLPDDEIFQMAIVHVSDRVSFLVNSTLPRERVKELIDDLIVVK